MNKQKQTHTQMNKEWENEWFNNFVRYIKEIEMKQKMICNIILKNK